MQQQQKYQESDDRVEINQFIRLFECCIGDDKHFCEKPVSLKCIGNACKSCILELTCSEIKCNYCLKLHDVRDMKSLVENENRSLVDLIKNNLLNELFQVLKVRFEDTINSMEGLLFSDNIERNISFIESEIDLRIESLKQQLDQFGENFRKKLDIIKENIKYLTSDETLTEMPQQLQSIQKNFNIDLNSFYVYQQKLKLCKQQMDELHTQIPKMKFEWSNVNIEQAMIGKLIQNYCDYNEVKSIKSYEIPGFAWFARMNMNKNGQILITDRRYKSIIMTDTDGNFMRSFQEQNLFSEPFAICTNKNNDIFIGDHIDKNIFVFDANFKLLRRFGNEYLIESSSMAIDDGNETDDTDTKQTPTLLYVTSKFMNTVTVWNSDTGNFVTKFKINKPEYIKICEKKIAIIGRLNNSNFYAFNPQLTDSNKNIIYSANCIYLVNKKTYDVLNTISLSDWFDLKGLFIDNNSNIYTCAREFYIDESINEINQSFNIISTKLRYLYIFHEKTGKCLQKTQLDLLSDISDMIVLKKKILFSFRDSVKIIEFV